MKYCIIATFNGRNHNIYTEDRIGADYVFDLISVDLYNGRITMWSGDTLLAAVTKREGQIER